MSDIKFNSLIPELSVSDIEKTKEFYLKYNMKELKTNFVFCN